MPTYNASNIILVVEDDREIGEVILEVLLGETRHRVYLVTNAHEALRAVKEMRPDLFLLDYQLPSMTGLQLFDLINSAEGLRDIPTIMMSANLPWEEMAKRKIIGLEKPFDLDDFVRVVEKIMQDRSYRQTPQP